MSRHKAQADDDTPAAGCDHDDDQLEDEDAHVHGHVYTDADINKRWEAFKKKYKKKYGSQQEEQMRKKCFTKALLMVQKLNEMYMQGTSDFEAQINEWSDMTDQEKKGGMKLMRGPRR